MGVPRQPIPAKLFVGMLTRRIELFDLCCSHLSQQFGAIDMRTDAVPWNHSSYYERELGTHLLRQFIAFERLIDPGALAAIKRETNQLEAALSQQDAPSGPRTINIDPGYLTEAKVVLASTKDHAHRVYLGSSIYAHVELRFDKEQRGFVTMDHTYYDFRDDHCRAWFDHARQLLRKHLRESDGMR